MAQIAEKKRLNYIDDAKALAIFLMIVGHLGYYKITDLLIYGFHIPLFFIVSGMFFNPDRSFRENVSKGFKQLIIPYLCFEIINLSIGWISPYQHPEQFHGITGLGIIKAALLGIFFGQDYVTKISFLPLGPLWFLVALFWDRTLFAALSKLFKNKYLLLVVSFVVGLGLYFGLSKNILPFKSAGTNIFSIRCAAMALPFYAFGYLLKGIDFKAINYRPLITVVLAAFYVVSSLYNGLCGIDELLFGKNIVLYYLNAVVGTLAVILFFSMVEMPEYIHSVGRNTLLILGMSAFPVFIYKFFQTLIFHDTYIAHYYIYVPLSVACIVVIMPLRKFFEKYLPFALGK